MSTQLEDRLRTAFTDAVADVTLEAPLLPRVAAAHARRRRYQLVAAAAVLGITCATVLLPKSGDGDTVRPAGPSIDGEVEITYVPDGQRFVGVVDGQSLNAAVGLNERAIRTVRTRDAQFEGVSWRLSVRVAHVDTSAGIGLLATALSGNPTRSARNLTVRGHEAVLSHKLTALGAPDIAFLLWVEQPGLILSVGGHAMDGAPQVPDDELMRVADGLVVHDSAADSG